MAGEALEIALPENVFNRHDQAPFVEPENPGAPGKPFPDGGGPGGFDEVAVSKDSPGGFQSGKQAGGSFHLRCRTPSGGGTLSLACGANLNPVVGSSSPMLILASQSPRRMELLQIAGYEFIAMSPMVEEIHRKGETPEEYVERLARSKAMAVRADSSDWVLAADTTVVCGEALLEKPLDRADAARMLRLLSGRRHDVLTGVCLRHQGHSLSAVERTGVWFDAIEEREIADYVASGEPMDKAGAYGIQGLASKFVSRIEGCFFNVVGLPVSRVRRLLKEAGYPFSQG